ncbi:XRE family transcriptional regulator [Seongchinamella unica]|uniref:XRE family transcriptional regulator n=1 Tax=Seongchinamella unica TaxID=2547392 RepID=A0A4R5LNJ9_9GAMM|nr:helix-turn-helix transcriptional regulator [Seongchinamella unica]TDG11895.1 XRE family transcriptional regulator [Seongchinamella unica]
MSQVAALLNTLKRELKASGITYANVADRLGLSESSVKRMFSESKLSLDRLEALCQIAGLDISDLVRKMASERKRINRLTQEQEREVAADPKLLLVAICVLNAWTFEEIIATYTLSEHEVIQLLARLDRLRLIDLQPLNRFRLTVGSDFQWIPNGPIQRFFSRDVQPRFMRSSFTGPGEKFEFRSGMLSRASNATMLKKLDRLLAEFNELHQEDSGLPLEERFGSSLLIAFRPWEFSVFRDLRRDPQEKIF